MTEIWSLFYLLQNYVLLGYSNKNKNFAALSFLDQNLKNNFFGISSNIITRKHELMLNKMS